MFPSNKNLRAAGLEHLAKLPNGVHELSPESEAILARAAEKAKIAAERHIKRES